MRCEVCFRHCEIPEGGRGFCGARTVRDGLVVPENYGRVTSLALDPIEKKPLARFYPGNYILNVGSYGCNLRCPFCQNDSISYGPDVAYAREEAVTLTPKLLADKAQELSHEKPGNLGLAFTYNEPLIGWEFVRDAARIARACGLLNILVTNGTAELPILEELGPCIDAMNIDLKGFTEGYYRSLGGDLDTVKAFIARAAQLCHVELTTLIVPGENDSPEEMRALSAWVAGLRDAGGRPIGESIPLHVSRFFPRFQMTDRGPTPVKTVCALAEAARERLRYVYTGNC